MIKLTARIINGKKCGYHVEVNGTTYNVIKHPQGGWKIINTATGLHIPSAVNLDDAKATIAMEEGITA